jgi:gliding motility-associated-like protein
MSLKGIIFFCVSFLSLCLAAQKSTLVANAGPYQKICSGAQVTLGGDSTAEKGQKPYTYSWMPAISVYYPDSSNPIASPTITTTYTVTVKDFLGDSAKGTITVYVYPYSLSVKPKDTTIKAGQTITLHAQVSAGDSIIYWSSGGSMYNQSTLNPDVFPVATTTYNVVAAFSHGCAIYDSVVVNVIPSNELVFYNSFTPNGDGANDYFYIGNIGLYPNNTLQIYNRYGQLIYNETGYNNDWKGTSLGTDVPCGTYFYILDTHDAPGKFHGEVTIIK